MVKPARYMMKKVAMSEMGISMRGRRAISQFRRRRRSPAHQPEGDEQGFLHFRQRLTDDLRIIDQHIEFEIGLIRLLYVSQPLVEFIGNGDIIGAGLKE